MDTMTKELNQNSVYDWVQDMTVPLKSVKSDQLCNEPEPLNDQLDKMKEKKKFVADVQVFVEKYPKVYTAFIREQHQKLLEFIQIYTENHEGTK